MSKKTKLITIFIITGIFVLLILFNWILSAVIHNRKEVPVPSITGKSVVDALDIVSKYNLNLKKVASEFHPDLPRGTITRQEPLPGMTVREGKTIKVTISQGSELIFVPDITGQAVRSAELLLRNNMLEVGNKTEVYSLKYEKDTVISQEPEIDTIVNKNSLVHITVSLGTPPENILLMPDFINKNISELKDWCTKNFINYEIEEQVLAAAPGTVLLQAPGPDSIITTQTIIKATIASVNKSGTAAGKEQKQPQGEMIYYEVPAGGNDQKVRIVLLDNDGEKEIYSSVQAPGTKINIPVAKKKNMRVRIFINNILVEEKEY